MTAAMHLDPSSVEAVAQRVAELLRGEETAGELIDAAEVARRFGVSRDWVYRNAQRLGCVRLSEKGRGRLRFDPAVVAKRLATPKPAPTRTPVRARRCGHAELLPVRGA